MPPANEISRKTSVLIKEAPTPPEYATRIWPPNSYFKLQTTGAGGYRETILILKSLSTEYAPKEVLILKISRSTEIFLF